MRQDDYQAALERWQRYHDEYERRVRMWMVIWPVASIGVTSALVCLVVWLS